MAKNHKDFTTRASCYLIYSTTIYKMYVITVQPSVSQLRNWATEKLASLLNGKVRKRNLGHFILHLVSFLFISFGHQMSFIVIPATLESFEKNILHFLPPWLTYNFPSLIHSAYIYQVPTKSQEILGTKVHQWTKQRSVFEHLHSSGGK